MARYANSLLPAAAYQANGLVTQAQRRKHRKCVTPFAREKDDNKNNNGYIVYIIFVIIIIFIYSSDSRNNVEINLKQAKATTSTPVHLKFFI